MTETKGRSPRGPGTRRLVCAGLIMACLVGALAWNVSRSSHVAAAHVQPGVVRYASGDLVYTFHLVSGTEGLFTRDGDTEGRENLARERPADASRLRRLLEEDLGVQSLEELREPHRDTIERMRALGYL